MVLAVALPVTVLMWVWWMTRQWRGIDGPAMRTPAWISVVAAVLLVGFGIVRNFSGSSWTRWLHSDAFVG